MCQFASAAAERQLVTVGSERSLDGISIILLLSSFGFSILFLPLTFSLFRLGGTNYWHTGKLASRSVGTNIGRLPIYPYFYIMLRIFYIFLLLSTLSYGQSVHDLARTGDVVAMKKLLDEQPNQVNQLSEQGLSPFLLAAYRGNNGVANLLVERGADIKTCFSEGSAIYGVIYKNNPAIFELLLQKGVSVNDTCQFSQFGTPLHFAMSLKRYELVGLILKQKPNLSVLDQHGKSIRELLTLYNDEKLINLFKLDEK